MNNTNQTLILATSILLGFMLIAAAIFFSSTPSLQGQAIQQENQNEVQLDLTIAGSPKREDQQLRRIYGNQDAGTTIVEFSDFECPFCSRVHPTLQRIVDESDGKINWEYRHLPLDIHKNAGPSAIASECVGDLAGNEAFWQYASALLANQRDLSEAFLESEALKHDINLQAYQSCILSTDIASRIQTDSNRALALGGSGTPFSVIEFSDGTIRVVSGALPYENWVQILKAKN